MQCPLEQSTTDVADRLTGEEQEDASLSDAGLGGERSLLVTGIGIAGSLYSATVVGLIDPLFADSELGESRAAGLTHAVLFGSLVGSVGFGSLADNFGRGRPVLCSLAALSFFSSIGAASAGKISGATADALCTELMVWLFFLGLTAGGEYPVAASYIIESVSGQEGLPAPRALASAYLCLVLGQLFAPLVLLAFLSMHVEVKVVWRLAFVFGAVFSFLSFVVRWCWAREATIFAQQRVSSGRGRGGCCRNGLALVLRSATALRRTLLGTCSAAFFVGLLANGLFLREFTVLLLPDGSSAASEETSIELASTSLLASLLSIPGYIATFFFARQGRRRWQLRGFIAVAACLVGLALASYADVRSSICRILYALLLMLVAGGLGATAHFVPVEVFPTCVRATSLGISMAAGCLGWATAIWALPFILDGHGLWLVALVLALASALGVICTSLLTPRYGRRTLQATLQLGPGQDLRESTNIALQQSSQFQACPNCEVMVERDGGCNVITCANCQDRWCFVCLGGDCRAWACKKLESERLTSTLEALPGILWPSSLPSRPTPSNELA